MREYRLQIPSDLVWVLPVRAALYRSTTAGQRLKMVYKNGDLLILCGALPSLFGFQHI
jgi:hypothetical protein